VKLDRLTPVGNPVNSYSQEDKLVKGTAFWLVNLAKDKNI
jgi:hypothetical protein